MNPRKMMLAIAGLSLSSILLVGCDRSVTAKKTETVTSPGGTTTTTVEKTVESSGDNPPANSAGESVPPKKDKD